MSWIYSRRLHRVETIERLSQSFVESLKRLIGHCQSADPGAFTPSDFADFAWGQKDLDEIVRAIRKEEGES